jgi:hypothetical protein
MKLILQIAVGVLLGSLAATAISALLALAGFAAPSNTVADRQPHAAAPGSPVNSTTGSTSEQPYTPPPNTTLPSTTQLDQRSPSDLAKARAEQDQRLSPPATTAPATAPPVIRHATPEDAAEKPAR